MQRGHSHLIWAYLFFWCGALAAALGFWRVVRSSVAPAAHLAPETVLSMTMFVVYLGGALLTVRRLPTQSLPAARGSVLMLGGVGLFLASMLLSLH